MKRPLYSLNIGYSFFFLARTSPFDIKEPIRIFTIPFKGSREVADYVADAKRDPGTAYKARRKDA